jgi:isopenicillin N synthase-like dioxygenase
LDIGPLGNTRYPNRWIAEEVLPTFREHVESYYTSFQQTATYLLQAIEQGLALPPGSMMARAFPDGSELRLNHYPAISVRELTTENTRRIWPHTDLGMLSLLIQDNQGGLEFEDRSKPGCFVPVQNESKTDLIVNVSDMMQRWTNGVLRAGLHRVVPPQQKGADRSNPERDCILPRRFSVVFLFRPGEESSAGPMQNFVNESRPATCDEISALGYLERMNELVYG